MSPRLWRVTRTWREVVADTATEAVELAKVGEHTDVRSELITNMRPSELPWAHWPWQQCRARVEPRKGHHGRCELLPHGPETDHALERGMDIPRWSTRWTG